MADPFRRPLGLVLAPGGALGSWQAAFLRTLEKEAGLAFDSVLGLSAGSLTGVFYALDRMEEAVARWKKIDGRILRFSPRLFPPALFSEEPLLEIVGFTHDEERAKKDARCRLTVVSARVARDKPVYAAFTPGAREGWDAPLADHLAASCAIPLIFPRRRVSYRGETLSLFDGGVPCREPMDFGALGPCEDVIVLEMVRPEEMGRVGKGFGGSIDQKARENIRRLMDQGSASLRKAQRPPRVFRVPPSRVLAFTQLDFKASNIKGALELGEADARAFMARPDDFLS